jgi:hypothetical protein
MRQTDSNPPPMSHSPAYCPHYASPASSSPAVPSTPRLHRPVPAHLSDRTDKFPHVPDRIKASASSATSGSTDATNSRVQNAPQLYPYQSDLERGDVAERSRRHGNRSHSTSHRIESRQRSREMEQQPPSTVIRYVQSDIEGDDEDGEEPDHAIWILVSLSDPCCTLTEILTRYGSFGCQFWTLFTVSSVACSLSSHSSSCSLFRPSDFVRRNGHSAPVSFGRSARSIENTSKLSTPNQSTTPISLSSVQLA